MLNHLYIFCFLFLLIFSCYSGKKAAKDDPEVVKCVQYAWRIYEEAENYLYKKEYYIAKDSYLKVLKFDCVEGRKIGSRRNKMLWTDLINNRIRQIDTTLQRERREERRRCNSMLEYGDTLYSRGNYEDSRECYIRYSKDCSSSKDKMVIDAKILKLDSIIRVDDSLKKEKKCSSILKQADELYAYKDYERSLQMVRAYQYWACPIQDTNEFNSKIRVLDSLIKIGKN